MQFKTLIFVLWLSRTKFQKRLLFLRLCAKITKYAIYNSFGSSTTDKFDSKLSDIDLLVEIDVPDPIERGDKLLSLWDTFESFFHRKVDLLTDSSIRNLYLRKSIDSTKILIYDVKRS